MTIRRSRPEDIDFIIEAVMEAEKSGSDKLSYSGLFDMEPERVHGLLTAVFDEEIEGQELYLPNFVVAEEDGKLAGALSAWVEAEDGVGSNMIKGNIFGFLLGAERMAAIADRAAALADMAVERDAGTLQIENVYVHPSFRGRSLAGAMMERQIKDNLAAGKRFECVQSVLLGNNTSSLKAFEKAGFSIKKRNTTANPRIFDVLSCDTKILVEKKINRSDYE
jgi:ribosomal protein S18 acetylase RimI-like enzyme